MQSHVQPVAITTSATTTQAVRLSDKLYGRIILPSVANTSLTFYESDEEAGTYALCSDVGSSGVLTVPTAASAPQSIAFPTVLIGSRWVKMVANVGAVTAKLITKDE